MGARRRSGELWISVKGKILSAMSVRRIPAEHRWGEDCLSWVDRVPWDRYKEALDADGEVPEIWLLMPGRQGKMPNKSNLLKRKARCLGSSISKRKTLRSMGILGDAGAVPSCSGD